MGKSWAISAKAKRVLLIIILVKLIFLAIYTFPRGSNVMVVNEKYLIKTPGCRIVDTDPFNEKVMYYVYKMDEVVCSGNTPLILSNQTSIWINETVRRKMNLPETIECCYRNFKRGSPDTAPKDAVVDDLAVFETSCNIFNKSAKMRHSDEFIEVICKNKEKVVYKDYHAFIIPKRTKKVVPRKKFNEKPSVLIIGIDSVSRLNLYRQMPKTVQLMKILNAVELTTLNKVADNTYPNLMAVLTGQTADEIQKTCWKNRTAYFDNCTYIWDKYRSKGYLTAFGEDACEMSMFLLLAVGFRQQPTDYYTVTYMKQNEGEIAHIRKDNAFLCSGSRLALGVLMDYATKFALNLTAADIPFWGHFWGTSLTHDYLNIPSNADDIYETIFKSFYDHGVFEKTVVIFMSDHGMRFGSFRKTQEGLIEDRLPFAFYLIPKWIQEKYPVAMENLRVNSKRLTSHFDTYATLLDILNVENLGNPKREVLPYGSKGISLFQQIPLERTCRTAGIPENFCACYLRHQEISTKDLIVGVSVAAIVKHINRMLKDHFDKCSPLLLDKVISARFGELDEERNGFIIVLTTVPGGGMFEATTVHNFQTNSSEVLGFVSRINAYGNDSYCLNEEKMKHLQLYCYCNTFLL